MSGRNFVRKEFCQEGILSGRNFVRRRALPGRNFVKKEFCQEAGSARKRALPGSVLCFGVVCVVYFLFLGAGGRVSFRGCEGGWGRVSFGVGCCCLLSFFGGAGGESALELCVLSSAGNGGESASGGAKGEWRRVSFGVVCVVVFFFPGRGSFQGCVGPRGRGGESALELCVLSSFFFGGKSASRGCVGDGGASQLWSCVCCRLLFFGGESASRGCVGDGGATQLWSCVCCRFLFFGGAKGTGGESASGARKGCRALFFAEHASLQSTFLCKAQSTLLCRALSFAEHAPLQSTLLCRARSSAEHAPLQSKLLCRAHFFAERASSKLIFSQKGAEQAPGIPPQPAQCLENCFPEKGGFRVREFPEVETLLCQRVRGLRSVSFQLPCEEDVLQSAFEDKPLCVPRAAAAERGGGVRRL